VRHIRNWTPAHPLLKLGIVTSDFGHDFNVSFAALAVGEDGKLGSRNPTPRQRLSYSDDSEWPKGSRGRKKF
jgi:hypothetical protein